MTTSSSRETAAAFRGGGLRGARSRAFRSLLRAGVIALVACCLVGCVSSSGNESSNGRDRDLSKDVEDQMTLSADVRKEQRQKLRKRFRAMKDAVVNGDLKTLQDLWIHPTGVTYSMEELSSMYTRRGEKMAARVRGASIVDPPGVKIETPSRSIRSRHTNARYVSSLLIQNSFGSTLNLPAVYTDDAWRFVQPIKLQRSN